jgi:hypothetical protein
MKKNAAFFYSALTYRKLARQLFVRVPDIWQRQ